MIKPENATSFQVLYDPDTDKAVTVRLQAQEEVIDFSINDKPTCRVTIEESEMLISLLVQEIFDLDEAIEFIKAEYNKTEQLDV